MKKVFSGTMVLLLTLAMTGCGVSASLPKGAAENEILTTRAVDQNKTVITVRVENGISQYGSLEEVLEEKFPQVDFVLRHDGSINSEYTIRENLEAGVACDLLMSRSLTTIDDIAADYLLDLSAESFVDQYYVNAVNSCAGTDGKLYYLPGPSDVYGIVYDKTMFEENGWELPHSYSEFVELLNTIRDAGLTATYTDQEGKVQTDEVVPIQPSMMYPDMFQIVFNTYGYESVFGGTENFRWLTDYQNGNGSLVGHLEPAVEKFKGLFDDGILSLADWDMQPGTRSSMMYTYHTTAMIIECQNAVGYAETFAADGEEPHEVAMMPFWTSDEPDSDYLYSIPSYYMAINKSAAEESEEKKELLLEIYSYLSSAEGQGMLIADGPRISSVKGVPMEEAAFSDAIRDTIANGRIVSNFYLAAGENSKQVEKQLRSTAPDMIQGKISVEDWLLAADQVRDDFLAGEQDEETVYGQVENTLTRLESAYTVAEMYRDLTGADIGICLGGVWKNGTNGYFYKGDITDKSLACVTPAKESTADEADPMVGTIVTATMTGAQILDVLNTSDAGESSTEGESPYYVAAGLTVRFNPWAGSGNCVLSCKTADGNELDPDASYKVAYFYNSLPEGAAVAEESLGETWQDSFLRWLEEQGGVIKVPDMTLKLDYSGK